MKKSHYLAYLNQYHNKLPIDVEKTFKQIKRNKKTQKTKNNKRKNVSSDLINVQKRIINKNGFDQNINPNIQIKHTKVQNAQYYQQNKEHPLKSCLIQSKVKNQKSNKNQANLNIQNYRKLKRQDLPKQKILRQTNVHLNKCSFQPSHCCENLFIVENQTENFLIVCQKCSMKFANKFPFPLQLLKPATQSPYSYIKLIKKSQQLTQNKKKLQTILHYQRQNLNRTITNINQYYQNLINIILQSKSSLVNQLQKINKNNQEVVMNLLNDQKDNIKIINKKIQELQKLCINEKTLKIIDDAQIQKIFSENPLKQRIISLSQIEIQFPIDIIEKFKDCFKKSEFCIKFQKQEIKQNQQHQVQFQGNRQNQCINGQVQSSVRNQFKEKIEQHNEIQRQQHDNEFCDQITSPQTQKEIHFNVQQTQSQIKNPYQQTTDQQLNKISSSEELLIQSLRGKQYDFDKFNHNVNQIHPLKHNSNINLKTEPSTMRIDDINSRVNDFYHQQNRVNDFYHQQKIAPFNYIINEIPPQQKKDKNQQSNSKNNFVKFLHNEYNQDQDLMCDEQLNLSISHPIHEHKGKKLQYQPGSKYKNKNKQLNKQNQKQIIKHKKQFENIMQLKGDDNKQNLKKFISSQSHYPLTLSQLQSQYLLSQQNDKTNSIIDTSSFLIKNNSLNITNENKNEISFQLDQNIIVDGNILSVQENQQENLNIISPAFKII